MTSPISTRTVAGFTATVTVYGEGFLTTITGPDDIEIDSYVFTYRDSATLWAYSRLEEILQYRRRKEQP